MSDLFKGAFAGGFAVLATYPIDTVKTRLQLSMSNPLSLRGLYSGVSSPLLAVAMEKSVLFYAFNKLTTTSGTSNNFINGVSAGLLTTFVVTPAERVKIVAQSRKSDTLSALRHIVTRDPVSLGRGWTATLIREVPGYGFYFSSYYYFKRHVLGLSMNEPIRNPVHALLSGGVAGAIPWVFIYPSDVIKTTMQAKNIGIVAAVRDIYNRSANPVKTFYKGYTTGLLRAFMIHSFVFLGYECLSGLE